MNTVPFGVLERLLCQGVVSGYGVGNSSESSPLSKASVTLSSTDVDETILTSIWRTDYREASVGEVRTEGKCRCYVKVG